jgi:hypothetical protein
LVSSNLNIPLWHPRKKPCSIKLLASLFAGDDVVVYRAVTFVTGNAKKLAEVQKIMGDAGRKLVSINAYIPLFSH